MMPGGHLATSVGLAAVGYAATGSVELAAGCFTGGFLIDVDHYLDYLVFEGPWRHPDPASFLRYYFTDQPKRVVLPLHSVELMTLLALAAYLWPLKFLVGYLLGAAMHLVCDIAVNGDYVIRNRYLFYVFTYRASVGFLTCNLLDSLPLKPGTGSKPFREFFGWRPPQLGRKHRQETKTSEWVSRIDSDKGTA